MDITVKYMTNNDCYKKHLDHTVKGIMVHSTGTSGVMSNSWYSRWNKPGVEKAVHAFIDNTGILQTLPWEIAGWHSGSGDLGKSKNANNTGYVGFEICEPAGHTYSGGTMINYDANKNAEYFNTVYNYAVELCVYLCKKFNLTQDNIICHSEGHAMGIASNHSDVMQWFPKHGKSMDTFREDVRKKLNGEDVDTMETFKMSQDMNFRKSPNGTKLDLIPEGTEVTGTVKYSGSVGWLYATYNGKDGCVAVLPESRGYAVKVEKEETDYKSLYEDTLASLKAAESENEELRSKLSEIKSIATI